MTTLIGWPEDLERYTAAMLWQFAWQEFGKSLFYMRFMHPDHSGRDTQPERVSELCRSLAGEGMQRRFPDSPENRRWLLNLLSDFAEETENQC